MALIVLLGQDLSALHFATLTVLLRKWWEEWWEREAITLEVEVFGAFWRTAAPPNFQTILSLRPQSIAMPGAPVAVPALDNPKSVVTGTITATITGIANLSASKWSYVSQWHQPAKSQDETAGAIEIFLK